MPIPANLIANIRISRQVAVLLEPVGESTVTLRSPRCMSRKTNPLNNPHLTLRHYPSLKRAKASTTSLPRPSRNMAASIHNHPASIVPSVKRLNEDIHTTARHATRPPMTKAGFINIVSGGKTVMVTVADEAAAAAGAGGASA